ncbi:major facilitator superfamily domain-containing protein 12-like isoform X1 [Antedon mediterranea]|uniref:major facilitator superfamily domain-containing protein 12-like isoform X1 n=1 Tax=Antedon mediterranea TaxID=105859 RepID=UPI003AF47908
MTSEEPKTLSLVRRYTYGVGHVLNDLCASMWFSYLLLFFHQVLKFENNIAGYLMLLGQITDGICTPLIGYESDRKDISCRYGKRKTWHLIGTFCVTCSFVFIFNDCIGCHDDTTSIIKFVYYAPFIVIFQFGWASTQISHLALLPELTSNKSERTELNAIRYAFTIISNILVYTLCLILIDVIMKTSTGNLTPADKPQFMELSFLVVGIGLVFSCIFHIGTRENASIGNRSIQANNQRSKPMRWRCWLKQIQFYQVAMIYMCARLMVNISQVYIPMYLLETLQSNKDSVAIIPLVVYVSSFLASVFVKFVNDHLGRKITYGIGALLILVACVCFYFIHNGKYIYIPTVLLGVGGSTVLVTSLSMTADLINLNTESGAFVYGAMSFTDKLSNGIVIAVIQQFHPCRTCCDKCGRFYREILSFVPGAAAIISLVVLLTLIPVNIGKRDNIVALEDNEDERKALLACAQETNAYIEEDPART